MSYDWEHEGDPARVQKILERLNNGETTDQIFGTNQKAMQQIEDLISGLAYQYPDPVAREEERAKQEQEELNELIAQWNKEHPDQPLK